MSHQQVEPHGKSTKPATNWFIAALQLFLQIVLPLLLIAVALFGAKQLFDNRPIPKVVPVEEVVPVVSVVDSRASIERVHVNVEGTVEPMWEAGLSAQVAGQVIEVSDSFQGGRMVSKGEVLVSIERTPYVAHYARAQAAIATARRVLAEEEAQGAQGLKEWTRGGKPASTAGDLTVRRPQIAAARAEVASAEATLQNAALDLDRTLVRAPFDCMVEMRAVSPGDVVAVGRSLGKLLGTAVYEARLVMSPAQAALLPLPVGGQPADGEPLTIELTSSTLPGRSWAGTITRTDARIDSQNRLVTAVAEVKDPLGNPNNLLPVGAYVRATIPGRSYSGVQMVPESAIVEDRFLWTVVDGKLERVELQREFTRDGQACVRFFKDPQSPRRVVVQPLPSFQDGLSVEVKEDPA